MGDVFCFIQTDAETLYVRVHVCLTACFLVSFLSLTLLLLSCFLSSVDFLSFFLTMLLLTILFSFILTRYPNHFILFKSLLKCLKLLKFFVFYLSLSFCAILLSQLFLFYLCLLTFFLLLVLAPTALVL